jgi:hypothetical protein
LWLLRAYRQGGFATAIRKRLGQDLASGEVRAVLDALAAEGLVVSDRTGERIRWRVAEQAAFPSSGA